MSPTVGTFEYYSSIVNREEYVIYKIYIKSKSESHLTNQNQIEKHCLLLSNKTVVRVYTFFLLDVFRLFRNRNWAWDNLKYIWKSSHLNWIVYFEWNRGLWCLKTPHIIPSMQKGHLIGELALMSPHIQLTYVPLQMSVWCDPLRFCPESWCSTPWWPPRHHYPSHRIPFSCPSLFSFFCKGWFGRQVQRKTNLRVNGI